MSPARLRLVALWFSQAARVTADNALRLYIVLLLLPGQPNVWHLVTALLTLPAIAFAPLNGALTNSLPKPKVLLAAAGAGWALVAIFAQIGDAWLLGWFLVAITMALYGPTRSALLPAAAEETHWPLTRINGFFELGSAAAVVVGMLLAASFHEAGQSAIPLILALHGLAFASALFVHFSTDLRRPEYPAQALRGFFRDVGRICREQEAPFCLIGLASLRALATALLGALVADSVTTAGLSHDKISQLIQVGVWLGVGVAAGSFLAGLHKHPRRVLGWVPLATTGLMLVVLLLALGVTPCSTLSVILGFLVGLINVPLAATFQVDVPPDARGNAMAVRNFCDYLMTTLVVLTLFGLGAWLSAQGQLWFLALLAFLLTALCWRQWYREVMELVLEGIFLLIYRIRGHGPGLDLIPLKGPVLVVANHAAWIDPFWLAKVLPRRVIAMMTSVFYDIPSLRWIFVHVVHAIRVEASTYRREVPELQEALAALDRGEMVLLFPEGAMRKRENLPLKQFGQGIWHLLQDRPHVPVVVCWIEGNYGSFFSYWKGLPTKNKPFDWGRHIDIAVGAPQMLSEEIRGDLRKTRIYLMQECLQARSLLGLPPFSLTQEMDAEDDT